MMDIIRKLKWIRNISLGIMLFAAAIMCFWEQYAVAIIIMLGGVGYEWFYYRCPHCRTHLDSRMKLNDHTHCPQCGKVIAHVHTE